MKCPKCESENTQRLEVVYHGGTQDINTTSMTVGGAHGVAFGIGGAATKTSGQSQSILAQRAAPPSKKSYKWALLIMLIGFVSMAPGTAVAVITGLLIMAAGGYLGKNVFQFNSNQFPTLFQEWLDSWLCNKCGTVYHQA